MDDPHMNDQPADTPNMPPFDLAPGLREYYSSQAKLMLAQYKNINRLLGPTDDYTHPGDFCEILLRDFLRRFLPPSLSADKGFFHGRAALDGKDIHCPDIDILIHDTHEYRPLFRMGDFVIVQPQAVRGIIQVKRTFSKVQVWRGLRNVIVAKQHLRNVLRKEDARRTRQSGMPPRVFSGVVGFADEIGRKPGFYSNQLLRSWLKYGRQPSQPTDMYMLPSFVGSLARLSLVKHGPNWNWRYAAYDSVHRKRANVGIQLLLLSIYVELQAESGTQLPLSFPEDLKPFHVFPVLRITKAEFDADGSILLHRNDKRRGRYRRAEGNLGDMVHLINDRESALVVTEDLECEPCPPAIIVERPNGRERYDLIPPWEETN